MRLTHGTLFLPLPLAPSDLQQLSNFSQMAELGVAPDIPVLKANTADRTVGGSTQALPSPADA